MPPFHFAAEYCHGLLPATPPYFAFIDIFDYAATPLNNTSGCAPGRYWHWLPLISSHSHYAFFRLSPFLRALFFVCRELPDTAAFDYWFTPAYCQAAAEGFRSCIADYSRLFFADTLLEFSLQLRRRLMPPGWLMPSFFVR
jgi:hypothetical protein